jgi:hypothetical protein
MDFGPLLLSPTSPSALLSYIIGRQSYPTTLIVGSSREDFLNALSADIIGEPSPHDEVDPVPDHLTAPPNHPLLSSVLYQTAVAKHIRLLFVSTVSHLRAYLAVLTSTSPATPAPPNHEPRTHSRPPLLLIYGFIDLHRDSSEWSAQGLMSSASILVQCARRISFRPVVVEPKTRDGQPASSTVLDDPLPLLGSGNGDERSWTGRRMEMRRVLGRWFRFERGPWDEGMQ